MTRRHLALAGLLVVIALLIAALTRGPDVLGSLAPAAAPPPTVAPTVVPTAMAAIAARTTRPRALSSRPPRSVGPAQTIVLARLADAELPLDAPPSVSARVIDATLIREGSPLAGLGGYMVAQGRRWHVDPVFLLAFISSFDVPWPLPSALHNVGHIRAPAGSSGVQGYRAFVSWRQGINAWYHLIHNLYIGQWRLRTLEAVLPIYAPGTGRHAVETDVNAMRDMVLAWRGMAALQ